MQIGDRTGQEVKPFIRASAHPQELSGQSQQAGQHTSAYFSKRCEDTHLVSGLCRLPVAALGLFAFGREQDPNLVVSRYISPLQRNSLFKHSEYLKLQPQIPAESLGAE